MTRSQVIGGLRWTAEAIAVAVVVLMIINWQTVLLCVTILMSEHRPALLKDASWDSPASAVRFERRFHAGVPERDLLAWLDDNKFAVNGPARKANRSVNGLPCNEAVSVTWTRDAAGRLVDANAVVTQIACL
jgi:hypothetical protein